jgi:hypothetical protein
MKERRPAQATGEAGGVCGLTGFFALAFSTGLCVVLAFDFSDGVGLTKAALAVRVAGFDRCAGLAAAGRDKAAVRTGCAAGGGDGVSLCPGTEWPSSEGAAPRACDAAATGIEAGAAGCCSVFSADVVEDGSADAVGSDVVGNDGALGNAGIFGAAGKAGTLELPGSDGTEAVAGIEGIFGIEGTPAPGASDVGSLLVIPAGGASVSDEMPLCAQAGAATVSIHTTCPITTRRIAHLPNHGNSVVRPSHGFDARAVSRGQTPLFRSR